MDLIFLPSKEEKIRLILVDREAIFRAGIRQILSSHEDIEIVAECEPGEEVIGLVEDLFPNIVLVDVNLPSLNGIDLARQISRRSPSTRVILLSSYPSEEQLFQAIKAGAGAYLSKNVSPEELFETIRKVYQGDYPINDYLLKEPKIAERVLRQFQDLSLMEGEIGSMTVPLTPREKEILSHIAEGNSNKQIARIFHLSEQTIKNHVTSILRKLNANDRTHAVILALRHGWISLNKEK